MASSTTATKIINAETAKRQFVLNPHNRPVTEESKKLIDRLPVERLKGCCYPTELAVSRRPGFKPTSRGKYSIPQQVTVSSKKRVLNNSV